MAAKKSKAPVELTDKGDASHPNIAKLKSALLQKYKTQKILAMADEKFLYTPVDRISSGELGLDIALGGGYPKGRIIKIAGRFSNGKSILLANSMKTFTNTEKRLVLFIDPDRSTTGDWLREQKVDINYVEYVAPETAEEALDIAEGAVYTNEYAAIYLDSIARVTPATELEGSVGDWTQGLKARLCNKFFRKLGGRYSSLFMRGKTADLPTFFFTNHIFTDLNKKYKKDTTPGGMEQDNAAHIILNLFKVEDIWRGPADAPEDERDYIGWYVRAFVEKNKVAPPHKSTTFGVLNEPYLGHPAYSLFHADTFRRIGLKLGIFEKAGAWYSVVGTKEKFQGEDKFHTAIMASPAILHSVVVKCRETFPKLPLAFDVDRLCEYINE